MNTYLKVMWRVALYFALPLAMILLPLLVAFSFWQKFPAGEKVSLLISLVVVYYAFFFTRKTLRGRGQL